MAKSPVPAKPVLPQTEIVALAKFARLAWDMGEPTQTIDSLGAVWEFEQVRDANTRLVIQRFGRDGELEEPARLLASGQVSQADMSREGSDVIVAAVLNAISDPA